MLTVLALVKGLQKIYLLKFGTVLPLFVSGAKIKDTIIFED